MPAAVSPHAAWEGTGHRGGQSPRGLGKTRNAPFHTVTRVGKQGEAEGGHGVVLGLLTASCGPEQAPHGSPLPRSERPGPGHCRPPRGLLG